MKQPTLRNVLTGVLVALVLVHTDLAAAPDDRGWLGIYTDPVRELPSIEAQAGGATSLRGATCARTRKSAWGRRHHFWVG